MSELYANSELCQTCGRCCKQMWWFTRNPSDALRFGWLDPSIVTVELTQPGIWRIRLHLVCQQLEEKNGLFRCKVWDGQRPDYCASYPRSFFNCGLTREAMQAEAEFCPALKELLL